MIINTTIVPKVSLGGIAIGENIEDVISRLSKSYKITRDLNCAAINDGLITAYFDGEGIISSLSCNSNFKGSYLDKLWPGMSVLDVMENTSAQTAWSGYVKVNNIEGIGLLLPEDRDDFESLTDALGVAHVFDELWIYEY
jgi:hypothetical protein